jgi:outer membrane protein
MCRKIVLFALMLIPATAAFAQGAQKVAHVNYNEIVMAMPEITVMRDSLNKSQEAYTAEFKTIKDEYDKKYTAFLNQQDSLIQSIKVRRMQELQDFESRMAEFEKYAQSMQGQLQEYFLGIVQDKVLKAVNDVATENHYTYVLNSQVLLFSSPQSSIDATPLVKAKLGLK